MNQFLELFGDKTISWLVAVIVAGVFIYGCYKKVDKYFTDKALKDNEKDQEFKKIISQVKLYPTWHQQSIGAQERIDSRFQATDDKIDKISKSIDVLIGSLSELRDERRRDNATTSRYRIIRFADELRCDKEHTKSKEHFDQILGDIKNYEMYCDSHPDYENDKAKFAIESVRAIYRKNMEDNTFL